MSGITARVLSALQEQPTHQDFVVHGAQRHEYVIAPSQRRGDEYSLEDRIRRVRRRARFLGRLPTWEEASDLFDEEEFQSHFGLERSGASRTVAFPALDDDMGAA